MYGCTLVTGFVAKNSDTPREVMTTAGGCPRFEAPDPLGYRIIPGPIMSRMAPIIGAHQAAIVVHMKIHGTATRIASTTMLIRITLAEVGHGSRTI